MNSAWCLKITKFFYKAMFAIVGEWRGGGAPPYYIFFRRLPPIETDAPPMGHTLYLTKKLPHLKNNPPFPWKLEAPVHEMIPRKSTIFNNLKSN